MTNDSVRAAVVLATGVFLDIREVARVMIPQGGGAIVDTASTAGVRGGLGLHGCTAAKFTVVGLTESTAAELSAHDISVQGSQRPCSFPGRHRCGRSVPGERGGLVRQRRLPGDRRRK